MEAVRDTNKYLTDRAPWHMKDDPKGREVVVRTSLEAIYVLALFLSPYIPVAAEKICEKLHTPIIPLKQLRTNFQNLKPGTQIDVGEILFSKLEVRQR